MKTNKTFLATVLILWLMGMLVSKLYSQNNTSSPYSSIGLGDIHQSIGPQQGMGGTGIALSLDGYYNFSNPAANHSIPNKAVMMELGIFYKYTASENDETNQVNQDFNLSYFTLIFPPKKDYTFSMGLKPYSNVGYNIDLISSIEGSGEQYQSRFSGEGGINQIFIGNALNLGKGLSIGANVSFLWGNISSTEQISLGSQSNQQIFNESKYALIGLKADYGLQYELKIGEEKLLRLGAIFEHPLVMSGAQTTLTYSSDNLDEIEEPESITNLKLPPAWGAGIAYQASKSWTFALDYYQQAWQNASLWDEQNYSSYIRINGGVEFRPQSEIYNAKRPPRFRAGAYYIDSHLELRDTPIREYGFTAGLGLPFRNAGALNLSYEYKIRGTRSEGLILENSHNISISCTLPDLWFIKRKVD